MKHSNEKDQDEVLLQRLRQIVLDNLENEQFSVERFSFVVGCYLLEVLQIYYAILLKIF